MMELTVASLGLPTARGEDDFVQRITDSPLTAEEYEFFAKAAKHVGVTEQFKDVLATFPMENGTPAGFKHVMTLDGQVLRVDLQRDISYDKDGKLRATNVLFSADSANPYEVASIAPLLANLTCNPGIIYDLFINNEKANVGRKFTTRDEVMAELGNILGPGADISVELNNPFEQDFNAILEEAEKFREMLSPYRVVIKVPHTGPVNASNVHQLLEGKKTLSDSYRDVATDDAFLSHRLALKLHDEGYRINYTLMFEPYQTQMALQAKPYFINTFLRQRLGQSQTVSGLVSAYEATGMKSYLTELRDYLAKWDHYSPAEQESVELLDVLNYGKYLLKYRHFADAEGADGLDQMRHNLRVLRNCNLPDTRLIVCSMEGPENYPDLDKMLVEPEFMDMHHKVVITAEPGYLAKFTTSNQVTTYQRRFMNAAAGEA